MNKLSKQKLHLSNLPKLFREQWFEREVDFWQPYIDEMKQRGVKRDYSDDQFLHEFIVQALKDRQYLVAAYVINDRSDIFEQSPMVYAMKLNDPTLLFVLLAFGNNVNGAYYKDIDSEEEYSLLRLAYENGYEALFNLLLLHPKIDLNVMESWETEDSEVSVFIGQGYLYDFFCPALILLDKKFEQVFPYLSIDVNHEYGEKTLFLLAADENNFEAMTRLYHLGANIHPESDNWGSPLFRGLSQYQSKGQSKLLDWYADLYEPLIYQDPDIGGGLRGLLESDVSDEVREKFGLQFWPLVRQFDEHQLSKQQYRLFAPHIEPIYQCDPELASLATKMDATSSDVSAYQNGIFLRRHTLRSVSILNDMERIYRVGFANNVYDIKALLSVGDGYLQLTVNDEFGIQDFILSDSLSVSLLRNEFHSTMKYIDLGNLTEFQLSHRLLSAYIQDWIEVHTYIKDNFGYRLFCFNTYEEYIKFRGITDDGTELMHDAKRGLSAFL